MDNSSIKLFNLSGKIFSEFGEKSTFYLKFNYQNEYLNTTWNGNTPFTFNLVPTINPFDADEFTSRRYGMDGVYNYKLTDKTHVSFAYWEWNCKHEPTNGNWFSDSVSLDTEKVTGGFIQLGIAFPLTDSIISDSKTLI